MLSILVGVYPGALLLVVAAVAAAVARSRLAQSTRTPDPRRRLLSSSAFLVVACVVATTVFVIDLGGDEHWDGGKLLVYNAVFFITAIGAIACLISGIRTPGAPTADDVRARPA